MKEDCRTLLGLLVRMVVMMYVGMEAYAEHGLGDVGGTAISRRQEREEAATRDLLRLMQNLPRIRHPGLEALGG